MVLVTYKHRLHPVFQTRLECESFSAYPCLRARISPLPCVSDLYLFTHIRLQLCANTFELWLLV